MLSFISFKCRGNLWSDITPVPQFSPNVVILKIQYKHEYIEPMDYIRAIIIKNEQSQKAYNLATRVINGTLQTTWHDNTVVVALTPATFHCSMN